MARETGRVACERPSKGYVYWYVVVDLDGERYRLKGYQTRGGKWMRFRSEQDARDALEEIRADIRRGLSPLQAIADFLPNGAPETLFRRHYELFLKAKSKQGRAGRGRQLSDARLEELHGHLRRGHLDPLLDVSIQAIHYGVLEDWRDWLLDEVTTGIGGRVRKGLAPKTARNVLADVRTCLRWLAKRRDLEAVPEFPPITVEEYGPRIPTPDAQDRILAAIPWPKRGAFLARGYMGLRPSEAARANLEDYDFARDVLTVHGKGGRVRYLPADPEVARWIREHHSPPAPVRDAAAPPAPLFPNPKAWGDERRWTKASARRVMLDAMQTVGLRFKPNEALRHAFGTGAANRGAELGRIGAFLGHTDPRTTRRYMKLAGEGLVGVLRPVTGPNPTKPEKKRKMRPENPLDSM